MDAELADYRLDELDRRLAAMPKGVERDYYAGQAANLRGELKASEKLLRRALEGLRASRDARAADALETIADDETKLYRYGRASRAFDEYFAVTAEKQGDDDSKADRKGDVKDDAKIVALLSQVKPMKVTWHGAVRLPMTQNAIGSNTAELETNGVKEHWLLDTGANYSVATRSFAKAAGIRVLPGFAATGAGVTGIENKLQVGVLPSLRIGGATVRNVAFLILDDANLKISAGDLNFQINAILGYPVLQALGVVTFAQDGTFEAGPTARRGVTTVPLYMQRLDPVALFGVKDASVPFTLDTGASSTDLSVRYYERFKDAGLGWKEGHDEAGGAGGSVKRTIFRQPRVELKVGDRTAVLKNVSITPKKTNAGLDELYGNVGQDLFRDFESVTFDFRQMTFGVGAPRAVDAAVAR